MGALMMEGLWAAIVGVVVMAGRKPYRGHPHDGPWVIVGVVVMA